MTAGANPAAAPRRARLAAAAVVLAGLAAYANSIAGSFFFDDRQSIAENPTLRHLWRLGEVLTPNLGGGVTVNGRPILNLSLAVNYAISADAAWSYHLLNLGFHLLAGLALFGLVRRTLELCRGQDFARGLDPVGFGLAVALLWTVHPLQTESVTYVVQRAESLMGLFYLATLYAFVRGAAAGGRAGRTWLGLSVAACLLGMGTKEVMVTAPAMVLLYDRTFLAGSFAEAWRRRRAYYGALAATWILLAVLVAQTGGNRGGTVGFGVGVAWWAYGLTQFQAVARYLQLALWPHPLVFEYGTFWVKRAGEVLPYALVVAPLALATLWALVRPARFGSGARALGFAGAWFFGILAPSSLMPGTIQMIVEHRAYLPLAAVLAAAAWAAERALARAPALARPAALALVALAFGFLTFRRNGLYRSEIALWADTVAKRPGNSVAQYNLGFALDQAGRLPEAMEHFVRAWQLRPDLAETHYSLGFALFQQGRAEAAVAQYEEALKLKPAYLEAENNLGAALAALGRTDEALAHYRAALKLDPGDPHVHDSLGNLYLQLDRPEQAAAEYAEAVRLDPASPVAQTNLGGALLQLGRGPEALPHLEEAARLAPDLPQAQAKLGDALMEANRAVDAVPHYEAALRGNPNDVQAQTNLAIALGASGRLPEAVDHYRAALRLDPSLADAHFDLGNALARMGRFPEAAEEFEAVLKLKPDDPGARASLEHLRQLQARAAP
ncbi:MAG TPA: tetratricopeptide repeat protein [Opitutaceae bacterium]|nr:tetratricopeptide repeat protein [Opitutaceae bacterium]